MTLRELHERIAASSPVHWTVLTVGPGWPGGLAVGDHVAAMAAGTAGTGPGADSRAADVGDAPAAAARAAASDTARVAASGTARVAASDTARVGASGAARVSAGDAAAGRTAGVRAGPAFDPADGATAHTHRAVLRSDVDLVLTWGLRESERDYFEPWLGNLGRMTEVRADRILLDVLWRGSLVDRLLGLAFDRYLLPFPRSRQPRVKGLPDRFFPREEAEPWRLVHELSFPDGVAFDRQVHRSGLRVE